MVRQRPRLILGASADVVRSLPPDLKRRVRAALDGLLSGSLRGEPLRGELAGDLRIRVGRFRIVYRLTKSHIEVIAIGPRTTIYTELERERRGP